MASSGRISVLVSHELQAVLTGMRNAPRDIAAQLRKHTKSVAEPAWRESVRANATTRIQVRVLSDTARAAVSDSNVTLKSATVGSLHGTPASALAAAAEFGVGPEKQVTSRSRKGNTYTRRMGGAFGPRRQRGNAVYPAARAVIPRLASLWAQTVVRGLHEAFEKGGK